MLGHFGWGGRQFSPLDKLWNRESSWNKYAYNPSSGAYGIPQAVPGSKMASAGQALADQRHHADPLGPALHQEPVRVPAPRLAARAGLRLVLILLLCASGAL